MAHDVFISYPSANKPIADAVCAGLEARGIRCWIAPRDVLGGANYGESIIDAIESARVVVMIFSSATNLSVAIVREAERAMNHNKPIIPFRVENVSIGRGLEFYLASCHWLDAIDPPLETHIARLAETVQALADLKTKAPFVAPSAPRRQHWRLPSTVAGLLLLAFLVWWCAGALFHPGTGSRELSLDYSVFSQGQSSITDFFQPGARLDPVYQKTGSSGSVAIKPTAAWLQECRSGSGLPAIELPAPGAKGAEGGVLLDFKLLNSSAKTISVTGVEAQVEQSQPILESLLAADLTSLRAGMFRLFNLGWAPVKAGSVAYNIQSATASSTPPPTVLPFATGQSNPLVSASVQAQYDALRQAGNQEAAFMATVTTEDGKNSVKLAQSIPLTASPAAAPHDASAVGEELAATLNLRTEGTNYTATAPDFSRVLAAGTSDEFQIALTAPTSSQHHLNIRLIYSDGANHQLDTGDFEVEMIVPNLR